MDRLGGQKCPRDLPLSGQFPSDQTGGGGGGSESGSRDEGRTEETGVTTERFAVSEACRLLDEACRLLNVSQPPRPADY